MLDIDDEIPVGIDLGTTNSCIGYWDGKEVKIVPNRIGEKTTPSVIYLYNNQFLIGEEILRDINLKDKSEKIYSIKRIIGQDYNDIGLEQEVKNLHYNIIRDESTNRPLIKLNINGEDEYKTPEFFSSLILQKLVNNLKKLVVKSIKKVVISVPAYFDDAQRSATIEAAKQAGLTVIRIINEPTAAALSYGLGQNFCPFKNKIQCFSEIFKNLREIRESQNAEIFNSNNQHDKDNDSHYDKENIKKLKNSLINNVEAKNVMVFDLGGGTFDLAILKLNLIQNEYEVKSKYSDKHLGGDDFDNKLVEYCLKNCNFDISNDQIDKKSKERLKKVCEYAKKFLSEQKEYEIDDDDDDNQEEEDIKTIIRIDNFINGKDLVVPITKSQFENEICNELFDRLTQHFDELIKGVELKKEDIDEIILVGGSTRMPKIKKIIKEYFKDCKSKINDEINPDEVVAYGATIQAAMLMNNGKNNPLKDVKLYDITPISYGTDVLNKSNNPKIKALGNKMSFIIPKWTRIPISKKKIYRTVKDNQDSMQICIFEGENDYLKDNKLLDKIILTDITRKPKGEVQCFVDFQIDENSILTVKAFEQSNGKKISKEIKVISNRNKIIDNDKESINGNINTSTIKINDKKIQDLLKKYQKNINNNKEKLKVLEELCDEIRKKIIAFIPEEKQEKQEKINENNIEIYFYNVYQLLECLEEILYINEDNKNDEKYIQEIKKYINIFKNQSTYYIKQIIYLFKGAKSEIFLNIFLYSIEQLNETGKNYLDNRQKYSRYYAKLYFEEIIRLYKKYKKYLTLRQPKSDIDEIEKNCEILLQNINSNAISLIYISKKNKQLIDSSNPYQNFQWDEERKDGEESLFTYLVGILNPNPENRSLSNEDYNLILDELNKINNLTMREISKAEDENIKSQLIEEKGICLGNIVKIKFIYQKGEDYEKYKKIIDDSVECGEQCNKNINNCIWYKEAIELQKQLEAKINEINIIKNKENEIIKIEIQDKLDTMDSYFEYEDKKRFINLILEDYPYDGYNEEEFKKKFNLDKIDRELIEFLSKKYYPGNYPKNTREEREIYFIMEYICTKLNSLIKDYKK